jgi:hypothetical protein
MGTKVKLDMMGCLRFAGAYVVLVLASSPCYAGGPKIQTTEIPADAGKVLEPPFHFLLTLPGYKPDRLVHDSDMFSTWGELALVPSHGTSSTRSVLHQKLLRAAKDAGWSSAAELPEVETPDLRRYGITDQKEALALEKALASHNQNPPTRYSCRIWIASDGGFIVTSYRVDGN